MNKIQLIEKWEKRFDQYSEISRNIKYDIYIRSDAKRQSGCILRFLDDLSQLDTNQLIEQPKK